MYTQFQRFLATLLLFSMLLQGCHNPNLKLACEEVPKVPTSQQGANLVTLPNTLPVTPAQQALVPSHAVAAEKVSGTPTEGAHATPIASPIIITSSHAQDVDSAIGAPSSSRTTSVKPSPTSEPSPKAQGATQHPAHGVLDDASLVKHTPCKEAARTDIPVPVGPSTHTTQLALSPQGAAHPSQIDVKPSTNNTAPKVSSSVVSSNPVVPTYPSAQGYQVRFEGQAGGVWLAQVQDGWGRVQSLPVICASNQTPEQAIQLLSGKDPDQYKYWVHVLETDQLPWAPRFVYVGALSIRGGSRRDRVSDNDRSSMGTLFTVGIGSQGIETRFGARDHYADSMAANNAVNEGIRRANETRRLVTSIPTSSLGSGLDTSAFTRSSLHTPAFTRSSLEAPMLPRSSLHTPAFELHRSRDIQIRQEYEREEQWDRASEEFFRRSRQRADEQHARAVWEAEQRKREAWEREQELERARARHEREAWEREQELERARARHEREAWEREQELERHAREEKHDYEAFCRGEAPTPPTTNSTSGQQRAESPRRMVYEPGQAEAVSKQAYFRWKEQEEIRIAKEAEEQAKNIYSSRRRKQEDIVRQEAPLRAQEARRVRLDEVYRREERRRQEAPLREREERRARLDEAYRREERRRQEAPRREQEERRARLDEAHRREEERRRQEEAPVSNASVSPTAAHVPAARVQEDEDDNVEEVYTDYPATHAAASPPSTDPSPNESPTAWQPPFVARAAMASHSDKVVYGKVVFGKRISSSFPGLFPSSRSAGEEALEPHILAAACVQAEEDPKMSTNSVAARTAQTTSPTPWCVPFAQQGALEPGLESLFRSNIKLYNPVQSAPNATSARVSTAHVQTADEDRKMPAKPSANVQKEVSSTTTGSTQQQSSGTVVSRGFVLDSEGKLQPHEVRVPFAAPAGFQAFPGTTQDTPVHGEEDRKSAASLTPSGSPEETEQSVKAYIQAFQASTPEECAAMQSQGEQLLKSVEALKITKKESYRRQVETFETQDVDPVVWGTVLQKQHDNKVRTDALRDLRSQLVDILQPSSEVLETAGIKATTNEDNEVAYYSSDEDEQPLSSEKMQGRRELCKEVAKITKEVVEGIIESGPTLGTGAVLKVAGKALKMAKAAGVSKTATQAAKVSKKVAYGTKETKSVAKAAESIEKSAARATKVEQVTKTARAKLLPPRENVYQLAKEGKAHGKTYNTYLHKPENQLNKGIRSFEKRIAEHRDKVANPKKHYLNWHTLSEKNKQGVLRKWKIEVRRFTEEKWIYEGILRDRK